MKRYIAFILGMIFIGSFFVVNKQIVREVPVFLASEIRLLSGSCFLYLIGAFRKDISLHINRIDIRMILLQVFFGIFLFSLFSLNGLKRTSAVNSGAIMGLTPVFLLILGLFIKREKLTSRTLGIFLIACIGVIILQIGQTDRSMSSSLSGDILIFFAMIGESIFISASQFIKGAVHPLAMSAFMTFIGSLMFMPLALFTMQGFDWTSVDAMTWASVLYSGIGITAIGVFLMNYGAAKIPLSVTATLSTLMPASTCLLAVVFLHEELNKFQIIGLCLILSSALFTVSRSKKTQLKQTKVLEQENYEKI